MVLSLLTHLFAYPRPPLLLSKIHLHHSVFTRVLRPKVPNKKKGHAEIAEVAMIRYSSRKLMGAAARRSQLGPTSYSRFLFASRSRLNPGGVIESSNANPVALQMIDYALSLAHSQKSEESYAQGMLVLEQCLSSQSSSEDSDVVAAHNSKGMVLLAMSGLLFARGNYEHAMGKLQGIQELTESSLGVRGAALEALVGLNLQLGNDDTSSVVADKFLGLLEKDDQASGGRSFEVVVARAKAVKGLVELVRGNVESAQSFFQGLKDNEGCFGSVGLSYGEFLHAVRNLSQAKDLYHKVIEGVGKSQDFTDINSLGACNMAPDEILLAATCSLGQLESHVGNFGAAEEILTQALNKAEQLFGSHHPKVGVVLTCLALMFRQKAIQEHSSFLLIQEGLYRRAVELLKAPPLDTEGGWTIGTMWDIAALARGGYAEALSVQQNRRSEAEKMKNWAEAAWRNSRLTLAEALKFSESSTKVPVIDTRICRAL